MKKNKESYLFAIVDQVKRSAPHRKQPVLKLSVFKENTKLCVASVLEEYIHRTKELRTGTKLFVTYIAPHNAVSRDTISRWIRMIMEAAGIDIKRFAPHSTRAASTSKAASVNVPLNTILETAGWCRETTFTKFYKRQVLELVQDTDAFANAVLA